MRRLLERPLGPVRGPVAQRRQVLHGERPAGQREGREQEDRVRVQVTQPPGQQRRHVRAAGRSGGQRLQPERGTLPAPADLLSGRSVQVRRHLPDEPQGRTAVQRAELDAHRPSRLRDNAAQGPQDRAGAVRRAGGGEDGEGLPAGLGSPDQVVQQPGGLPVDPLQVVNDQQERPVRSQRPVRALVELEGRGRRLAGVRGRRRPRSAVVDRRRQHLVQERPGAGGRGQPVEQVTGRCQPHRGLGLVAGEADLRDPAECRADLRQQPGLPRPRLAEDHADDRPAAPVQAGAQVTQRRQLGLPAHEGRGHPSSVGPGGVRRRLSGRSRRGRGRRRGGGRGSGLPRCSGRRLLRWPLDTLVPGAGGAVSTHSTTSSPLRSSTAGTSGWPVTLPRPFPSGPRPPPPPAPPRCARSRTRRSTAAPPPSRRPAARSRPPPCAG